MKKFIIRIYLNPIRLVEMSITQKESEYLMALFELSEGGEVFIGTTFLARRMGVTPATVVDALDILFKKGYIIYVKRFGSKLTEKGKKVVNKLIWKHRVIETLLYNVIGGDVSEICRGIRGVELVIDDDVVRRVYEKMGRPCQCPHGRKIPDTSSF